ncbi:MAG: GNAT family protein [Alphaproteobacteria bacterium]|nr:GNAT family protein [Alphaproteobacteria bacterium]
MNQVPLDFVLITERLLIRRLRESDASDVCTAAQKAKSELQAWTNNSTILHHPEATFAFIAEGILTAINGTMFRAGFFDKDNGTFLGNITFGKLEKQRSHVWWVGYWCNSEYTNQGYTKEAVAGICQFLMEKFQVKRLVLECNPQNKASNSIARACGFALEGIQKNGYQNIQKEIQDVNMYAHTPETWEAFKNGH